MDGRGRLVEGEVAAEGPGSPAPASAGVFWRVGSTGRFAACLVRGPGGALHADRVHRRRRRAAFVFAFCSGGDDRGVYGGSGRLSGPLRASGGAVFGPAQHLPGEPRAPGRQGDAVRTGGEDVGHRADPGQHAAGQGPCGAGQPDAAGPPGEGVEAGRSRLDGGGQRLSAVVHGGPQPAFRGGAQKRGGRAPDGAA